MMAGKAKRLSPVFVLVLAILCFVVGAAAGFLGAVRGNFLSPVDEYADIGKNGQGGNGQGGTVHTGGDIDGELQIHFLELGNYYTGDCVYIKAGDTDVLIDAGSKSSSVPTISAYLDQYVTDNKLEYVIVTHAHEDHYAGFAANEGIFDLFECEVIIDFAQTNQKPDATMYNNYINKRDAEIVGTLEYFDPASIRISVSPALIYTQSPV